tara:strand:+ start:766 stop:1089 length:324 start_codon:yes stop_codon:yes gene_type:complete
MVWNILPATIAAVVPIGFNPSFSMEWSGTMTFYWLRSIQTCFNPSFSMEWSGTRFGKVFSKKVLRVSILVFQWNGLELITNNFIKDIPKCFNPSFSMEWSGTICNFK